MYKDYVTLWASLYKGASPIRIGQGQMGKGAYEVGTDSRILTYIASAMKVLGAFQENAEIE